jgi:hypothetical protein
MTKPSLFALTWLSLCAAALIALAAAVGVFWQTDGQPFQYTTLRGQTVEIYNQGLYQYDQSVIAVGFRIGDTYALLVGLPCFLISLWLARRGSLRGRLLLTGTLAYLLYLYLSLGFGAAYNNLLLAYILIISLTLLGFFAAIRTFDTDGLARHYAANAPTHGTGIFLIVTGAILFLIWFLLSLLPALLAGTVPVELGSYSTIITFVVDMGILAPALVSGGWLLLRHDPLGCLMAPILLVFMDVLGLGLVFMGCGQMLLGMMTIGQFIGMVVSFAILTFISIGFTLKLFRSIR